MVLGNTWECWSSWCPLVDICVSPDQSHTPLSHSARYNAWEPYVHFFYHHGNKHKNLFEQADMAAATRDILEIPLCSQFLLNCSALLIRYRLSVSYARMRKKNELWVHTYIIHYIVYNIIYMIYIYLYNIIYILMFYKLYFMFEKEK